MVRKIIANIMNANVRSMRTVWPLRILRMDNTPGLVHPYCAPVKLRLRGIPEKIAYYAVGIDVVGEKVHVFFNGNRYFRIVFPVVHETYYRGQFIALRLCLRYRCKRFY